MLFLAFTFYMTTLVALGGLSFNIHAQVKLLCVVCQKETDDSSSIKIHTSRIATVLIERFSMEHLQWV